VGCESDVEEDIEALSKDSSALQKITKAIAVVEAATEGGTDADAFRRQAQHRLASAAMQLHAEPRVPVAAGVQQGDELQYDQASPLLFEHIAYRRRSSPMQPSPDEQQDAQPTRVRRIRDALLDTGAAFNVVDVTTAKRMEREGAAKVVRWHVPSAFMTGGMSGVGGGCVVTVGKCKIECLLKDAGTGQWHAFTEDFEVIKGKRTFIVGMPFCAPKGRKGVHIDLGIDPVNSTERMLSVRHLDTDINTSLLSGEPAVAAQVQSVLNSKQPLVFTTEDCELKPWGETGVRMRLPVAAGDSLLCIPEGR